MIDSPVDWNLLNPMVSSLYRNDTEKGGMPSFDETAMIRALLIQELYGLMGKSTERKLFDKISFHNFLHYPEKMPDARTIWPFRERLSPSGMDRAL